MPLPDRLKAIREQLGYTQAGVSEKTGVGVSSLSEFETGKREPTISALNKLAGLYEKSVAFFLEEQPTASEVLLWRDRPPSPVCERIEAKFTKLCRQYRNLEEWTQSVAPDSIRGLQVLSYPDGYAAVDRLARKTAEELELGALPGVSLLKVLQEAYAVKIFHLVWESGGSSASWYSEALGPAVMLNATSKKWRRNFDLAHELFHLITWRAEGRPQPTGSEPKELDEQYADAFASRLLLPEVPVREAIEAVQSKDGSVSLDDMDEIARQFEVSVDALFWRLTHMYPGHDRETVRQWIDATKRLSGHGPRPDERPDTFPPRYLTLALKAVRLGEMSTARAAEYAGMRLSEIQRFLETDAPQQARLSLSPS